MDIENQEASGDIYNVKGNLNLHGGVLNVGALFLDGKTADVDIFSKSSQQNFLSQYSISYLDLISASLQKKTLIERNDVAFIQNEIGNVSEIAVIGIPGSGKTSLLYQLSGSLTNVVYISLKEKTLVGVLIHIINKINIVNSQPLIGQIDPEFALEMLQSLLIVSQMTLMLDDCETNAEVITKILPLQKFANKFIYASKNADEFTRAGLEPYVLKSFSEAEVRDFLNGYGIELDVLPFNELFEASKGNPLYLFYYSQFQITPLPKDIAHYHNAIWGSLNMQQREALILIALSYKPITTQIISELLGFKYLTEAADFAGGLTALIRLDNFSLDIFHPAFRDFIIEYLRIQGLLDDYKTKLGAYYLSKNDNLQAAHLLIDLDKKAINEIGFDILPEIINSGNLNFANKVILVLLSVKRSSIESGYLNCLLSSNYRIQNNFAEASKLLEISLVFFKKARNKKWYNYALMNKAISLVEDGQHEDGLALAEEVFRNSAKMGAIYGGQLLVNFSKMYVDLHEYEKAAMASHVAYQSFEKLEHIAGMVSSLANLASSLAKIKDYESVGKIYALKLLELSTKYGYPYNIELIALNVLTSVSRIERNYSDAKKYGERAVKLCQNYGLGSKTVLNLINYANVIRDEGSLNEALKVYDEALVVAASNGFKKDESRVYWILSNIYFERKELPESIEAIDKSIAIAEEINYFYGVAHGLEEKAQIHEFQQDFQKAAITFEQSYIKFSKLNDFGSERDKTLGRSILCYQQNGNIEKANELLSIFIDNSSSPDSIPGMQEVLKSSDSVIDIHAYYRKFAANNFNRDVDENYIRSYLVYLEYCQNNLTSSIAPFNDFLHILAENALKSRFGLTTLAILIEQSKALVSMAQTKILIQKMQSAISGFYVRDTAHETVFLAKIPYSYNIELVVFNDDPLCLKLSLNLLLFLYAAPELIASNKPVLEKYCKMNIMMKEELEANLGLKFPSSNITDIQTLHLGKANYQVPELIAVLETYEDAADLIKSPNNKVNSYFLGVAVRGLIDHFHHTNVERARNFTKVVTRKIAFFYDLTHLEEIKMQKDKYFVDFKTLDQIITKNTK